MQEELCYLSVGWPLAGEEKGRAYNGLKAAGPSASLAAVTLNDSSGMQDPY